MRKLGRLVMVMAVVALLVPAIVFAAAAKKYQVSGKVLEVTDTMITVEKGDEKWVISRDKDTKIEGDLKAGAKVTIQYRMVAADVEVKAEKKSAEKSAK